MIGADRSHHDMCKQGKFMASHPSAIDSQIQLDFVGAREGAAPGNEKRII